jgi:hypothetical protein
MKQTTRLHDFFHPVIMFHITGWKKSMRIKSALFMKRGCPKWGQSRREEGSLVNPNKQQATLNGIIWNAALRDGSFLYSAALFLADVHQAHCARNALYRQKWLRRCDQN